MKPLFLLLQFWLGVLHTLFGWIRQGYRWLVYEEKLTLRFCQRLVTVEKRLQGSRHLVFLYRFLRYANHHYHLIPPWIKLVNVAMIMAMMFGHPFLHQVKQEKKTKTQYAFYYEHGLKHYRHYLPQAEAQKMAAGYAQEFAQYYASPAYKEALRTALPSTPTPKLEEAAKQAPPVIRELKLAEVGFDLLRHFEGLRLKPYRDAAGKLTIGYGHLIRPSEAYTRITPAKAESLLLRDVAIAELLVKESVRVPLTISQFSALVVLVYNIGGYQFGTSTLLALINQGKYDAAAEEILRWEKANGKTLRGLARRRYAEYLLFTGKWRKQGE